MQSVISKLALRERKTRQIFIAYTMNHNLNYKMYVLEMSTILGTKYCSFLHIKTFSCQTILPQNFV